MWVSRHQKGKPFWNLLEQEMMGWQWHQLDHMQIICTSLQTDNHASTSPLSFCRLDALPAAQQTLCQSTEGTKQETQTTYKVTQRTNPKNKARANVLEFSPSFTRSSQSPDSFREHLKTRLFQSNFNNL